MLHILYTVDKKKKKVNEAAFQVQACQQEFVTATTCHTQPMHPAQGAECPGQLQRARRAACLSFGLPGVSWHKILPSLSYSAAKSKPKSSTSAYLRLVCSCWELISVRDFCGLEGGCLGLFCIVCVRQNSSTTAKEEAREGTSYPYSKEINSVIFHLEITTLAGFEKKIVFMQMIFALCFAE